MRLRCVNLYPTIMKNLIILLLVVFLSACGQNTNQVERSSKEMALASFNESDINSPVQLDVVERKLIRTGDLSFEVKDVLETKKSIEEICKALKAFSSSESQNNLDDRIQFFQTIRVPAERFDEFLAQLEKLAVQLENKSINTQDVTEEFIDVEARLATKKSLEERYREILKQAKTVADIVSIESQIANVRADIESMQGRLNYLKNQVAFSTLQVSYYQRIGTDFGFFSKAARAIGKGWDNFLSFIIVAINLWPFVLLLGVLWFLMRWWAKKRASTKAG
jgi:hypothetical protein